VTYLFLLLLLHIIFRRREWLTLSVFLLLFTFVSGASGGRSFLINMVYAALFSALLIAVATRFGLLALTTALFFLSFFGNCPTTIDFSVWYEASTIFALTVTLALVGYAFYISLAGQKVFQARLLQE